MKFKILLITITIASFSLVSHNISAQPTWQDATYDFCEKYVSNYKQPGFWTEFFASSSDTSEQVVKTSTEIYDICLKLDRGVINVGDANVEIVKRVNYLQSGIGGQLARELKDDIADNFIGYYKFLLILLGVVSTIVGIIVGIKSWSKN